MKFIKILLIFFVLNSCKKNDVKDIEIEVFRFDSKFASLNNDNIHQEMSQWDSTLQHFFEIYFPTILEPVLSRKRIYIDQELSLDSVMILYLDTLKDLHSLESDAEIQDKFNDFNQSILPLLEESFGRMNFYLPFISPPEKIITINSFRTLDYETAIYQDYKKNTDTLIVSLDMYLGSDSKYYDFFDLNDRMAYRRFFTQEKFLVVDALETWLESFYAQRLPYTTMLDKLIYHGKLVYLMQKFIPEYTINDILKFSLDEMEGFEQNETEVWNTIIEKDLYSNSIKNDHDKFFNYFPPLGTFTMKNDKEVPIPSRLGYFIGYKIIDSYMKENDISFKDLMQNTNSQEILLQSKYIPGEKDQESWFKKYWWISFVFIFFLGYFIYNKYSIKR